MPDNDEDGRKKRDPQKDGQNKNRSFALEEHLGEESKKNKGGRPPHYDKPEELEQRIFDYIAFCEEKQLRLTISGLVLFCGFCDRHSFYDYEKRPEFSHTIKKARTLIQMAYEENLHGRSAAGSIFALTNFDWDNKLNVNHEGDGIPITINKHYDRQEPEEQPKPE